MENRKHEDFKVHNNSNHCNFCDNDPLINYKTSYKTLERKYFEAFNFYFAKPVNEILANVSSAHVILFKDYMFYDDENNEYLKRYYKSDEIKPRVKALTEFYQNSYKPTRPNLCIIESNKIINKRNQKLNKLFKNRNNNEQNKDPNNNNINPENNEERKYEEENIENDNLILENILTSNFEKEEENESQLPMCYKYQEEIKDDNDILPFFDQKDEKTKISYDSSEHDIYNPDFSQNDLIKDFEQLMKPFKTNENKPLSLNKIKTRNTFKKETNLDNNNNGKQNYELLLEEIINKQKQNVVECPNNDVFLNSFKMNNNNILKDFSENRISDISELLNLHEIIRNSQKISTQSSAQKQKVSNKDKIDAPHIKKKENVSSQLTQDSTKRTTGNTTTASQNALKNPEKFNKKIHISHNTLFSQINKFYNKTGNVDQIFELIKKMQKEEDKASLLPLETKNVKANNRNCSNKSNKDLLSNTNPGSRFFGSQTDRVPDKAHEQLFMKSKNTISKLNINLLNEKKSKEKLIKQRSPSTSRHSNKKTFDNNNNMRKSSTKKSNDNPRNKPTKISFRSLNSNIYSSLRNRSNISSKSHIDTQRSSEVLVFKSQEQLAQKGSNVILGAQHKSQLENLEENESSYGFWTSRSNKVNIEDIKRRNKSPEIGKKLDGQKNFNLEREDYYNYGLKEKDGGKMKAKTDRFEKDKEINQFIKLAYENPQILKVKSSEVGKAQKKSEKGPGIKRNFKLNLPVNVKF